MITKTTRIISEIQFFITHQKSSSFSCRENAVGRALTVMHTHTHEYTTAQANGAQMSRETHDALHSHTRSRRIKALQPLATQGERDCI